MEKESKRPIIVKQRNFFAAGKTKDLSFRGAQLKKLKIVLKQNEAFIVEALHADLGKPSFESHFSELGVIYKEIDHALKHLQQWGKIKKVKTPLHLFPASSKIFYEPRGVVLIISPWNYPVQLAIVPLIGAIAAGNCTIIKPSESSPHVQKLLAKLINENFAAEYLFVVQGGINESSALLSENFDFIFFTGSTKVGKIVLRAAAENLTPVCLELGGKSPCVVDETANIGLAAQRIAWGKFLNAGQTCVAPDFVYVQERVKDEFIKKISLHIRNFFGGDSKQSAQFGRIVNTLHYKRLETLIKEHKLLLGGTFDEKTAYISPTLVEAKSFADPIMQEEIFGPILPILTFKERDQALEELKAKPKPLAFYIFATDKNTSQKFLSELSFGSGAINDCVLQLSNPHLPFGGVGPSGFGSYHGRYSFEVFSHQKAILHNSSWFDHKLRYPPYKKWQEKILKLIFS